MKHSMKHIMLDLETLSTQPTAAILSIGACEFDINGISPVNFYVNVSLGHIQAAESHTYFHASRETLDWWNLPKNSEAWHQLQLNRKFLKEAVFDFINYLPLDKNSYCTWSNGADFDLPIISHAIRYCDAITPWSHKNTRCYRTVKNLFPFVPFVPMGIAHRADHDAVAQANHLICIAKEFYNAFSINILEESSLCGAYRDLYNMPRM